METEATVRNKLEIYQEMHDRIYQLCELHNDNITKAMGYVSKFEINGDTIEYTTEYCHCSSCGTEYDYGYVPISYLWDENWLEEAKAKKEAEEAEKKRKEEALRAQREKEIERKQYEAYLALKEKYDGNN